MIEAMTMLDHFLAWRRNYRLAVPKLVERWQRRIPPIHPYGQEVVRDYLAQMSKAIDNPIEFERLAAMLRQRVADELRWEAQKAASAGSHKDAYRLRRQADRFEASHV